MSNFMDKFTDICGKIADSRYVSAISKGIMLLIPFTMVSAIFTILANPPVTADILAENAFLNTVFGGWFKWATANKAAISLPATMVNSLFAVISCYGIAFNLAQHYKQNARNSAIIAVFAFILVAGPVTDGAISTTYLGTAGIFFGILVSIATIEMIHLCEAKNIVLKLPKAVPPSVSSSFSAIIPLLLIIVVFYGISLLCSTTLGMSLPAAIMSILTPAINTVNTPFMVILIGVFALFLWCLGIHGTSISWALLGPLLMSSVASNGEIVAKGGAAVFAPVMLYSFVSAGGTGQVMALTLLCSKSKSKQLNAIGKVSLIPGIFSITEPIQFGAPIIYNPLLMIPFILSPVVNMLLGYLAYSTGILPIPYVGLWALMPIGIGELLRAMSIKSFIFAWINVAVGVLIYYPFFKAYEKQLLKKEAENEETEEE